MRMIVLVFVRVAVQDIIASGAAFECDNLLLSNMLSMPQSL